LKLPVLVFRLILLLPDLINLPLQIALFFYQVINFIFKLQLVRTGQIQVFNAVLNFEEFLLFFFLENSFLGLVAQLHFTPELLDLVLVLLVNSEFLNL